MTESVKARRGEAVSPAPESRPSSVVHIRDDAFAARMLESTLSGGYHAELVEDPKIRKWVEDRLYELCDDSHPIVAAVKPRLEMELRQKIESGVEQLVRADRIESIEKILASKNVHLTTSVALLLQEMSREELRNALDVALSVSSLDEFTDRINAVARSFGEDSYPRSAEPAARAGEMERGEPEPGTLADLVRQPHVRAMYIEAFADCPEDDNPAFIVLRPRLEKRLREELEAEIPKEFDLAARIRHTESIGQILASKHIRLTDEILQRMYELSWDELKVAVGVAISASSRDEFLEQMSLADRSRTDRESAERVKRAKAKLVESDESEKDGDWIRRTTHRCNWKMWYEMCRDCRDEDNPAFAVLKPRLEMQLRKEIEPRLVERYESAVAGCCAHTINKVLISKGIHLEDHEYRKLREYSWGRLRTMLAVALITTAGEDFKEQAGLVADQHPHDASDAN